MSTHLDLGWTASADINRKHWRLYLSTAEDRKGEQVVELDPDVTGYIIRNVDEGDYWIAVLAVSLAGTEEEWRNSPGRVKHTVTRESHKASAASASGGGTVSGGLSVSAVIDAPGQSDPPQKVEVIKGDDEYTGQLVTTTRVDRDGVTGEGGERAVTPPIPVHPGRGRGNGTQTWTVRGVSRDGRAGGSGATFHTPHLDMPNMEATVLASVVTGAVTGFSSAASTDAFEFNSSGVILRALPTAATATTANGWGTLGSGLLNDAIYGTYYTTGASIHSQVLDVGSDKAFVLECYDEFQRNTSVGVLDSLRVGDMPFPHNPAAAGGWNRRDFGPVWMARAIRGDHKPMMPVKPVRWRFRIGATTSACTGASWMDMPPMPWVAGRYVQVKMIVSEPLGLHQLVSSRVYIRAWVPWSEATVPAAHLPTPVAAIAALSTTDGNVIVGNGSTWVAESGETARTSLGCGSIAPAQQGEAVTDSVAADVATLVSDFNGLLAKLRTAQIIAS